MQNDRIERDVQPMGEMEGTCQGAGCGSVRERASYFGTQLRCRVGDTLRIANSDSSSEVSLPRGATKYEFFELNEQYSSTSSIEERLTVNVSLDACSCPPRTSQECEDKEMEVREVPSTRGTDAGSANADTNRRKPRGDAVVLWQGQGENSGNDLFFLLVSRGRRIEGARGVETSTFHLEHWRKENVSRGSEDRLQSFGAGLVFLDLHLCEFGAGVGWVGRK